MKQDPKNWQSLFQALYQEAKVEFSQKNQRESEPANEQFDRMFKEQYRQFMLELNDDHRMSMTKIESDLILPTKQPLNKVIKTMTEITYLTTILHNICQTLTHEITDGFKGVSKYQQKDGSFITTYTNAEPPGRIKDIIGRDQGPSKYLNLQCFTEV